MDTDVLFNRIDQAIREALPSVLALSHQLHANPEIAFEELQSSAAVADVLGTHGFEVTRPYPHIPTSFLANYGAGPETVVICAEYDALPGLGHACGHNIIAASAVAAGIGLASVADDLGITVQVLGTPAEEHGGGKVLLLEAGAWDQALFSMMVHPGPDRHYSPVDDHSMLGVDRFRAQYTGLASHAAAAPQAALNAADAVVIAQVAIGLLRQQLPADTRVSAVVLEAGSVTNIVPGSATMEVEVRASTVPQLEDTKTRVIRCLEAGALATGCTVEFSQTEPRYEPLNQDEALGLLWDQALRSLGEDVSTPPQGIGGSTDMGNVSQRVAAIHPMVGLASTSAPIHTAEFATHALSDEADQLIPTSGRAMARTAVLALASTEVRDELKRRMTARALPSSY